ncbi:tail completion protein gp17 [Micromonospora orduensis]|uniref:tail completion protein gp17 n=1 Tax=Micromonospora orduensis TaxID=1420891 RepID=UPI0033D31562
MTVQAHADAVLARLRSAPGSPSLVVYDGQVPEGPAPAYVVVYLHADTPELPDSRSVQGASERFVLNVYCHSVGGAAVAARGVAQRVRGVLLDAVLSVPGRRCWPVRHVDSQPPQRDESTGRLVMDQVDVYRLESVPA